MRRKGDQRAGVTVGGAPFSTELGKPGGPGWGGGWNDELGFGPPTLGHSGFPSCAASHSTVTIIVLIRFYFLWFIRYRLSQV